MRAINRRRAGAADYRFVIGKKPRFLRRLATEFEINYTAFENFRVATTATLVYYDIAGAS